MRLGLIGAMESNIWVQVELKLDRSTSTEWAWFAPMAVGSESLKIWENCDAVDGVMARVQRAESVGLSEEQGIKELNKMGKWSDGQGGVQMSLMVMDSPFVMIRSRICPFLWVGLDTD